MRARALLLLICICFIPMQVASASFQLEYAEDADRGTNFYDPSPLRDTVEFDSPPVRWGGTGEYHGPSTNHRVDPWGCEAKHAQEVSPSGKYWGKYQFDRPTWEAHGGSAGSYGNAPESEQDLVASRVEYDAWPNC